MAYTPRTTHSAQTGTQSDEPSPAQRFSVNDRGNSQSGQNAKTVFHALEDWRDYLILIANRELRPDLRSTCHIGNLVEETLSDAQRTLKGINSVTTRELLSSLTRMLHRRLARLSQQQSLQSVGEEGPHGTLDSAWQTGSTSTADSDDVSLSRRREERQNLEVAIGCLPAHLRTVIELRTFGRQEFAAIGVTLSCSTKEAADSWVQAILRLQHLMFPIAGNPEGDTETLPRVEFSSSQPLVAAELASDAIARHLLDVDAALSRGDVPTATPDDIARQLSAADKLRLIQAEICLGRLDVERQERTATEEPVGQDAGWLSASVKDFRVRGRYVVLCELGRGGHASVFLGYDPALSRQVAIKVPRIDGAPSPDAESRFAREARALASLNHPNIVEVLDFGQEDAVFYIVEAVCLGPTLKEWMTRYERPVHSHLAARIVRDLSDAVHHAHSRNILHRDLKPANVLLRPCEAKSDPAQSCDSTAWFEGFPFSPVLTDFGIAKVLGEGVDEALTGPDVVLGSVPYIAPELALGKQSAVGWPVDVYGLGVILYELLTGTRPFDGGSQLQVLRSVTEDEPVPPHLRSDNVPADLEAICLKCLEKAPSQRYESAAELRQDLDRFLTGYPVTAKPVTVSRRFMRWCVRRPMQLAFVCVVILGLLSASVGGWWHSVALRQALEVSREQRRLAEAETLRADNEAQAAHEHREVAEAATREIKGHLFSLEAQAAHQALKRGDWQRCTELLEKYRQDPQIRLGFVWQYLWRISHLAKHSWRIPEGRFCCVAFSPDGSSLAGGTEVGDVLIWDSVTRKEVCRLRGHTSCVNVLCYSPDGQTVMTGSCDKSVRLWNVSSGEQQRVVFDGDKEIYASAFSPDGKLAAFGDDAGRLYLYDLIEDDVRSVTSVTDWRIESLAFSSDGTRLVAASFMDAHLFEVPDLKRVLTTGDPQYKVHAVVSASDDASFLWAGDSGIVHRSLFSENRSLTSLFERQEDIRCIAVDPATRYVATGMSSTIARVQHLDSGRIIEHLYGHQDRVAGITLSPDAQTVATASWDGTVRLWPVNRAGEWYDLPGVSGAEQIGFADQGNLLLVAGGGTIRAFQTGDWGQKYAISGNGFAVGAENGGRLMAVERDGVLTVCDTGNGRSLYTGSAGWSPSWIGNVVLLSDGMSVLGSFGNQVGIVSMNNPESRLVLAERTGPFVTGQAIPGTNRVVLADSHQKTFISVFSLNEDRVGFHLAGMTAPARQVAAGPRGVLVAAGSADHSVYVWDQHQRTLVNSLTGHHSPVTSVTFSEDGRYLASGDESGFVYIWSLAAGQATLVLNAHSRAVTDVAFSPDSSMLATATADTSEQPGEVRLWIANSAPE